MNPDPANDLALFGALQRGEEAALNRLITRWERPLFAFAWRYLHNEADAHDVVAEAFVRLYQHRLRLRPDTNVSAWLFTTLANLCRNQQRWRRRHATVSFDDPDSDAEAAELVQPDAPIAAAKLEHDETIGALTAAIDRLPHDLRVTLLLHHFEHLSYRDIADAVGCSERGVETRLYRARNRLRSELAHLFEVVS